MLLKESNHIGIITLICLCRKCNLEFAFYDIYRWSSQYKIYIYMFCINIFLFKKEIGMTDLERSGMTYRITY